MGVKVLADAVTAAPKRAAATAAVATPGRVAWVAEDIAARSTVSGYAALMNELQDLGRSDPTALSAVLTQVSDRLGAEAGRAQGPYAAFLAHLGRKVAEAARRGDVSALRLAGPSSGGRADLGAYAAQRDGSHARAAAVDLPQLLQAALEAARGSR